MKRMLNKTVIFTFLRLTTRPNKNTSLKMQSLPVFRWSRKQWMLIKKEGYFPAVWLDSFELIKRISKRISKRTSKNFLILQLKLGNQKSGKSTSKLWKMCILPIKMAVMNNYYNSSVILVIQNSGEFYIDN